MSYKDQTYQIKVLPFSFTSAPWLFTMVAREFASLIHRVRAQLYISFWTIGWAGLCPGNDVPSTRIWFSMLRVRFACGLGEIRAHPTTAVCLYQHLL